MVAKQGHGKISDVLNVSPIPVKAGKAPKPTKAAKPAAKPVKTVAKAAPSNAGVAIDKLMIIRANKITKAEVLPADAKLVVVSATNTCRPNTTRHKAMAFLFQCKTVGEFYKAYNSKKHYLTRAITLGLVKVAD